MLELSFWDYSIIVLYFLLLVAVGYFTKRKVHGVTDYFLAGRRLTLPLFVVTLVSTWYGGILGVGELSFNYGFVNWLTQGFFWYLSYLFFAFFLAKRVRQSNLFTIPDLLEKFYDKKTRFLGAIFNFIMTTPAPYLLSLGIIFGLLFGWPVWAGILLGAAVVLFYTVRGGFWADVYTDFIQFILMMTGVALVIPFAISKFGGLSFLQANLPAEHFTLTGTWTTQMILVWGFIACWTLVDPSFYQRCYATTDSKTAKNGILISILFWMLFDICTTFTGMYARAAMPMIDPTTAYAVFPAAILPVVVRGLFFTGMLATIMSTVDSFALSSAMNLSHDIYHKVFRPQASEEKVLSMTRWGVVVAVLFALILALRFESLVAMWYTIGTIGVSALLMPMLFGFFSKRKISGHLAFASMLLGAGTASFWMWYGYQHLYEGWPTYIWGLEPLYSGIAVSLLILIFARIFNKQSNVV